MDGGLGASDTSEKMIDISKLERRNVLWILLKASDGNGEKSGKSGREKTSLFASVSTEMALKVRLVRVTNKDKDCTALSFPPFSGLPIISV